MSEWVSERVGQCRYISTCLHEYGNVEIRNQSEHTRKTYKTEQQRTTTTTTATKCEFLVQTETENKGKLD